MAISEERRNRMLDAYGEARSKLAEALDIFHNAPGGLTEAGSSFPLAALGIRDRLVEVHQKMDRFLWSLEHEATIGKEE